MADRRDGEEPPFEGGSQPVRERPPEKPTGRGAAQTIVVVIGALVVVAALLWLLVPFGS